ncbi:hybrid sensor histidine kinase/response regulator [Roseateles sp.]|uniref:ATP-binding response regulator n=1 Tax=Roseateles sp. TaxID=1971397 RepID=UPI00359F9D34
MTRPGLDTPDDLQARLIISESPKSLLLGIGSGWLIVAALVHGNTSPEFLMRAGAWGGLLTVVLLRGIWLATRCGPTASAALRRRTLSRLQVNGVFSALAWGLSSSVMLPAGDLQHEAILILGIPLITMGGAMGRAVHAPIIAWLVLLTSAVFAIGLMTTPGATYRFLGVGYLFFGTVVTLFTRAQANAVRRERELNLEIEKLLRTAEQEQRKAQQLFERAEEARAQAESAREMEARAHAAKTRFLAAASHDLRQPMHSISLLLGVLQSRLQAPEQLALADKIQSSVATMESLFGNLLDISKLDAGAVQARLDDVPLAWLLHRVEQTWAPQAADKGLRLRVRPCRAVVRADAALLERMVGNLVANAIRYTQRGGVLVGCRPRGDRLALEVWDSGPGIEPRHLDAIFEEFFRIEAPGSRAEKGLGLGLSIVQRCAQLSGQQLGVASRVGRGSMFRLVMPRAAGMQSLPAAFAGPVAAASAAAALRGRFIVVVDDEALNAQALVDALQACEAHVVAAASCDEALSSLQAHLRVPDLIVTDYQLEDGRDGLEVVQRLREHYDEAIAALVVTANTDARLAPLAAGLQAGLLHKPIGLQRLLAAMASALSSPG